MYFHTQLTFKAEPFVMGPKLLKTNSKALTLRRRKKSLWQYFNPSVGFALEELNLWMRSRECSEFVLGIFHLDNMASIIFSYGEDMAFSSTERLIKIIAEGLGKNSKVLRVGIDDFLFAITAEDLDEVMSRIEKIFHSFTHYGSTLTETPTYFSFKAGTTLFNCKNTIESGLDEAFIALYESRNSVMRHVMFDEASKHLNIFKNNMSMAAYLQKAVTEGRLRLAYQPIIRISTGGVDSYEALLRIIDENGEVKSAGPYIPIAEEFGFIEDIDLKVFDLVYHELELDNDVVLGMNVSTISAIGDKWLNHVRSKLLDKGDIARRMIIEITETGLHRDSQKTVAFVDTLKSIGCQIAIDDFGAGYTSFTQLKLFNVDIIKIDGAFIRDLVDNPDSQLFVETLQNFAQAFCLDTIAECVETGDIARKLIQMKVPFLQGYYFNKALNYRPWIKDDRK